MEVDFVQQRDELEETYYLIKRGGELLGYAWKEEVFTYMGTEGWNRGTRIRDYHPIEWKCGRQLYEYTRLSHKTRREAVKFFLETEF